MNSIMLQTILGTLDAIDGLTDAQIALKCVLTGVKPCVPRFTPGVLRAYAQMTPRAPSPLEITLAGQQLAREWVKR
jgi:hypothetical protein